jgi:hypothetical protein
VKIRESKQRASVVDDLRRKERKYEQMENEWREEGTGREGRDKKERKDQ